MSETPGRHARQQSLPAWSQDHLRQARVLVAGCGTLGNEVLKNLALVGIGTLGLVDFDLVEAHNLGTSVLFRPQDIGQPKATVAAHRLQDLAPGLVTRTFLVDLTTGLGAGTLAGYDLVLGCLDGIHARWRLNRLCHIAGVPWIDAGIEAFSGQIAFFDAGDGPCYECAMTHSMWHRLNQRRRCALPATRLEAPSVPTNIMVAAHVASLQVQEAVAHLQARQNPDAWPTLAGGDRILASLAPYRSTLVHARRSDACLAHPEPGQPWTDLPGHPDTLTPAFLFEQTQTHTLELDWDLVSTLHCPTCGDLPVCIPDFHLTEAALRCPVCGQPRQPTWTHTVHPGDPLSTQTLAALGVPPQAWFTLVTTRERPLICRLTVPPDMRA